MRHFLKAVLVLCSMQAAARAADPADVIYVNGTVLTLDKQSSVRQAVAVKGDKVVATGTDEEIRKLAAAGTEVRDLKGRALVPGFYAAHDHFPSVGRIGLFNADLRSPPVGKVQSIDEVIAALKARALTVPKGKWVTGVGYDDTLLKEGRHPTREDLDKASTEHPIWISHISGHLGVANSVALSRAKITKETKEPQGGRIRRDPKTGEPNGVFEEVLSPVTRLLPIIPREEALAATEAAVKLYASKGVTTTVVAGGSAASVGNLKRALEAGILKFRVITMTSGAPAAEAREQIKALNSPLLRAGAIKLFQDGSIQGFTGYLSHAYCTPFENDPTYRGYPLRSREALTAKVKELHKAGYQIAIHGNGDGAIDDILAAFGEAQKETPRPDARHRIEHCQTARDDQLDAIRALGVTPSFFNAHVYYWGDRHEAIFLGPERAARISPLNSALQRSIRFTLHNDTPVTPVDPLALVWTAVARQTFKGKVLGENQRIGVEAALRAVTVDAAWQNFEENEKGTIEPGKLADFVVLDKNPLDVKPDDLRQLQIEQTVVGGKVIYAR